MNSSQCSSQQQFSLIFKSCYTQIAMGNHRVHVGSIYLFHCFQHTRVQKHSKEHWKSKSLYLYPPFPSPFPLTIFPFSISLFSPTALSPLNLSPSSSMSILIHATDIFTVTDALCCLTFIQSAQS